VRFRKVFEECQLLTFLAKRAFKYSHAPVCGGAVIDEGPKDFS